eukprot:175171_1
MAAAVPSKNEHGSIEGEPTLSRQISNISLPPPPPSPRSIIIPTDSFNLDAWLEKNKLLHLKEVFLSHNMTTFETITTTNTQFALLIASSLIIENNLVSTVVRAIQKLHANNNNTARNTSRDNDTDTPWDTPSAATTTEYIVVSTDEHDVLESLTQCLCDMTNCNTKLKEISNQYLARKKEIHHNKSKNIDRCKEKVNATFGKLTQIIQNRQKMLLTRLDHLNSDEDDDAKENKSDDERTDTVITTHIQEIDQTIKRHSEYLKNQINEYKTLVQSTSTNYDALDTVNERHNNQVQGRRRSILEMGNDSQHLHKRQRVHVLAECEKLKCVIEDEMVETDMDFVLDDEYLNQLLIYMKHSFGFIVQNIPKPSIKNVYFNTNHKEKVVIELADELEVNVNEYSVIHYQVAYFVKYYDHELNDEEHSSKSSGSSLFSDNYEDMPVTEGVNIAWKVMKLEESAGGGVEIECKDMEYDMTSAPGELRIKIRSYLTHKYIECKFWSAFSHDFVMNLYDIGVGGLYGAPKQTPELSVVYHEEDEEEDEEKKECFDKYYNISVSSPVTRFARRKEENYDMGLVPIFSIDPLSESGDITDVSQATDDEDTKPKRKKKKGNQSWGHSLNRKLTNLFSSNSNSLEEETPRTSARAKIKPFAKRSSFSKRRITSS